MFLMKPATSMFKANSEKDVLSADTWTVQFLGPGGCECEKFPWVQKQNQITFNLNDLCKKKNLSRILFLLLRTILKI